MKTTTTKLFKDKIHNSMGAHSWRWWWGKERKKKSYHMDKMLEEKTCKNKFSTSLTCTKLATFLVEKWMANLLTSTRKLLRVYLIFALSTIRIYGRTSTKAQIWKSTWVVRKQTIYWSHGTPFAKTKCTIRVLFIKLTILAVKSQKDRFLGSPKAKAVMSKKSKNMQKSCKSYAN